LVTAEQLLELSIQGRFELVAGELRNLAPDLVVEVVSPHDHFSEVEQKVASWLNAGSKVVLVADPRALTIRVYRQAEQIETLRLNDSFEGGMVVPDWKLSVRDAFGLS